MKPMDIGLIVSLDLEEKCFDVVKGFGLKSFQLQSWNKAHCTQEMANRIKAAKEACGIEITSFWAGWSGPCVWNFVDGPVSLGLVPSEYRAMRIQELKDWADFAKEIGAPAIVTHCGFLPENMTDLDFPRVVVAIREVAKHCERIGLGFWFETGQETPVTLLRHIEAIGTGNLGINLDPANLLMYGKGNPIDALDVFGKYVKGVHAKDGKCPSNGRNLGPEVKVGEGLVNYPEFIKKLAAIGYAGALTIEREIHGDQQRKDIIATIDDLARWKAEAGVK